MKKMNTLWHQANIMPKHPTMIERVKWHLEHQKHCRCRPIQKTVQQALKEDLKK